MAFSDQDRRVLSGFRSRACSPIPVLLVLALAACGGTAGEDGGSGRTDSAPGAAAANAGGNQDATDTPGTGPGGQRIRIEEVRIGGVLITIEIADTPALRELGLMHRDSLPANQGMLFVYPDEQMRSFWMRSTRIPLDIAFIDRNLSIVNIEQMEAQTDENTRSTSPAQYALEMSLGWFEANGVGTGDRLEF